MVKTLFYLCLSMALSVQTACVQNSGEATQCYSDRFPDDRDVFTEMVKKPHFKGGHNSLVSFLSANINHAEFFDNTSSVGVAFTDTARLTFIVNKRGGMSALSVTKAKDRKFIDEVTRAMKRSSCNWVAGGVEQSVNGWHQLEIFFSVEKIVEKELKTKMTITEL